MSMFKLKAIFKEYIWGGRNLIDNFSKEYNGEKLAESWELASHIDGTSIIETGEFKTKLFSEYLNIKGSIVLGSNAQKFDVFPVLIKLIDAEDDLSIQVHPNDEYALKNESSLGKTEMWYIVDAKADSFIYYGFSEVISKEEFASRIKNNTLTEVLNKVNVKKGQVFFIEAGTIHAIGKGIVVAEVQQNSNITYRVSDYDRLGPDGKKRELHIEKALEVTSRELVKEYTKTNEYLAKCKYFTVTKLDVEDEYVLKVDNSTFIHLLVLDGSCEISSSEETLVLEKGNSLFIEASIMNYYIKGKVELLMTRV